MAMFRAKCPCCGAWLEIDERRRSIESHVTAEEQAKSHEERFEAGLERVRRAKAEQERMMAEAEERERHRKERLASLFDEASKKVEEDGGKEEPPKKFWD